MRNPTFVLAASVSAAIVPAALSQTQTVTLIPQADATIFRDNNTPNDLLASGAQDSFFVGRTLNRANTTQRTLLRFDLSQIPACSTVRSVDLTLTLFAAGSGVSSPTISMHRLLSSWAEGFSGSSGGAGANSGPGDADWYFRNNPNLSWTTPGGDFVAAISASRSVPRTVTTYTWASTPTLVADVQGWLADPASNFGWLLRGDEVSPGSTRKFWSREALGASTRPVLRIEYAPATPTAITLQPASARACFTRSATFTVAATGTGLGYRWQIESAPGSDQWTDLADGPLSGVGTLAGAATPQLAISVITPTAASAFRCRVTGACGAPTSSPASLTICIADTDDGNGGGRCDGGVGIEDLLYYVGRYSEGTAAADLDDGSATGRPDGGVTIDDLLYYLQQYGLGC